MYSIKFICNGSFSINRDSNQNNKTFKTSIGTAYVLNDGCLSIVTNEADVFIFEAYKINGIEVDRSIGKNRIEKIILNGDSIVSIENGILSFGKMAIDIHEALKRFPGEIFKSLEIV